MRWNRLARNRKLKTVAGVILVVLVLLIGYGQAQTGCVEGAELCGSSLAGYVGGRVIFGGLLGSIFFAVRMLWQKLTSGQRTSSRTFRPSDAKRLWTSRSLSEQQFN